MRSKNLLPSLFTMLLVLSSVACFSQAAAQTAFIDGTRSLKIKKYELAKNQFDVAIKTSSSKEILKMSFVYKAFAFKGLNQHDSAISCLNKAIKLDPKDASIYLDRAQTYLKGKMALRAKQDFKIALLLDSSSEQAQAAHYYLGRLYLSNQNYESAISHLSSLIKLNPQDSEAYFLRGISKAELENTEGSIADFDLAITHQPYYKDAYINRAIQKLNKIPVLEKLAEGVECIEEVCSDLFKAQQLGARNVDDMIFLYCKNCDK